MMSAPKNVNQKEYSMELNEFVRIEDNILYSTLEPMQRADENVASVIVKQLDRHQSQVFIIDQLSERQWTGRQILNALAIAVKTLQSDTVAIKKGDVVAFYCNPSDWHVIWLLAVSIVGGIYAGSSDVYPQNETQHIVQSSGAKFIIASEKTIIKARNIAMELDGQVNRVFQLKLDHQTAKTGDEDCLFNLMRQTDDEAFNHLHSGDNTSENVTFLLDKANSIRSTVDFYAIHFSSGTTGKPKAVGRTHYQAMGVLNLNHPSIALGVEGMIFSNVTHFGHVGSMSSAINCLMIAGSLVISSLQPETWLTAVSKYKVTSVFFTPATVISISRFANDPNNIEFMRKNDFSSLNDILIAGEFLPLEISRQFLATFPSVKKFRQSYGSTEMAFVACVPKTYSDLENSLFSGIPLAGMSLKIERVQDGKENQVDASRCPEILPAYQIGHILIKGPTVSRYMNNETANQEAFDSQGYFRTGDGGYYDDRGFLLVTDRFKSIIKSDGYQVSPSELEDILISHPSVREAVVIGIPHEVHGHVARACVIVKEPVIGELYTPSATSIKSKEGAMSTIYLEERIKSYVAERVAPFKQLRGGVKFFTSFPLTILGKVDRKFLSVHFST